MINSASQFGGNYRGKGRAMAKAKDKMSKTMDEFGKGKLHSGSKTGPKVKNRKQAIAIGLNQARKAGGGKKRPEPMSDREFGVR